MQTMTHPFRKCHLQILRSLYDGQANGVTPKGYGEEGRLSSNDIRSSRGTGTGGDDVGTDDARTMRNDETESNKRKASEAIEGVGDESERPVGSEIWDLIERFLQQRIDYRPHKERQLHWAKVSAEAKSRLDYLASVSSVEEEKQLSLQLTRSSSLTPRTPMFSVSGRGTTTPTLSLTPLSSNRNAPRLSQNDREIASTMPSWNFINQMLQRRSQLCTQSCLSFRSQPFLARLRNEADMRCKILEGVLKRLKMGDATNKNDDKKRGISIMLNSAGKRQKLGMDSSKPSLGHFFSDSCSDSRVADIDDVCHDEDSIIESQMKLHLWSSLLLSVKEIVDE